MIHRALEKGTKKQCNVHFNCETKSHPCAQCTGKNCFAIFWDIPQVYYSPHVHQNSHFPSYTTHQKHTSSGVALLLYLVSALTDALTVYTVKCTYGVYYTCNVQRCLHIQHKLHIHDAPLRAVTAHNGHVMCTCSVQGRCTVQRCVV